MCMYSNVDRVKKGWPLLVTLLFLWLGSCDNPVTTDQRADCNHVDAEGLVIERGTSPVAVQWLGTVDGAVELDYGRRSGEMAVTFLDPDSSRVLGRAVCGQSLGWVVEDTAIVSIEPVPGDDWRVFMTGSRPGSTLVRFRVWHYEHADFTSQPIPVRVSGAICPPPTVAGAAAIFTVLNGSVTGSLDLAGAGDSLTVRIDWLDASGAALAIGDSCGNFSVSWTATDTSLADIVVAAGPPWVATVVPRADGSGSVQFHFADQGTTLFSTAPIPITVSGLACDSIQPAGLEATLTDSTLATSFGGLVAGGLTVTEGTQLSPVALDFLASDSAVIAIPTDCSDLSLDWSVGNDSLVAVILDSTWSVDINGLAPGSTFVQFKMLDQGIPIYTSPNLPVLVEPAQTHVPVDSNL